MTELDLDLALRVATDAARRAGDVILGADLAGLAIRTKSSPHDFVTQVDEQAQLEIVRVIRAAFPDHPVLGEEGDVGGAADSPYLWIVDPLDGTTNFLHGKPTCGTIIALRNGRQTLLGLLYFPSTGETFTAIWGRGALRNGKPVTLRATRGMDDAIITGNMRKRAKENDDGTYTVRLPDCASWENYGSAIEAFAEILRGHNDGLTYVGPHLWDVAAGCLLVEEAGGKARMELVDPSDLRGKTRCVASTPVLFDELCDITFTA